MADEQIPRLHTEIVQCISKAGNRYECIEVLIDGMSIGRIFPSKLGCHDQTDPRHLTHSAGRRPTTSSSRIHNPKALSPNQGGQMDALITLEHQYP